jgi:hypothetical protein
MNPENIQEHLIFVFSERLVNQQSHLQVAESRMVWYQLLYFQLHGSEEEKVEDKARNYIYNERSYKSFYRSIPIPEEIIPSKIIAKMTIK